jgi:hypothetical protein
MTRYIFIDETAQANLALGVRSAFKGISVGEPVRCGESWRIPWKAHIDGGEIRRAAKLAVELGQVRVLECEDKHD